MPSPMRFEPRITWAVSGPQLSVAEFPWVRHAGLALRRDGCWLRTVDGSLSLGATRSVQGRDELGVFEGWVAGCLDSTGTEIARLCAVAYTTLASVVFWIQTSCDVEATGTADSFVETTHRAPILHLPEMPTLGYTWGPIDAGTPGTWPEPRWGRSISELPRDVAYGVLVLGDTASDQFAVISPMDHFTVSPLTIEDVDGTPCVARGLHGAIERIPAGTSTGTLMTFGERFDDALRRWGDVLLRLGGGSREPLPDHPVRSWLGIWNAYGGYYADLFRPLDEAVLRGLRTEARRGGPPVAYVGLDLWYPYEHSGLAKDLRPDPAKYPDGLGPIAEEEEIPLFLHLSGIDAENDLEPRFRMLQGEGAACPDDPDFYPELARGLKREGAVGVWHDHLRQVQAQIPSMRSTLDGADTWFDRMCRGMASEDLEVMLSVHTAGFLLASTRHRNVTSARSGHDYLVKHHSQIAQLPREVAARYTVRSNSELNAGRLLVGSLLDALGLRAFHDVMITNAAHPEGFAEPDAEQEALVRALSAGPVGIGDKIGEADAAIIDRLCFPDGRLAQPDRPPAILWEPLADDLVVAVAGSHVGPFAWRYVGVFNVGTEPRQYVLHPQQFTKGEVAVLHLAPATNAADISGCLPAGRSDAYVLAPRLSGVGIVGFVDRIITAPSTHVRRCAVDGCSVELDFHVPAGHRYRLGWTDADPNRFEVDGGRIADVDIEEDLVCTAIDARDEQLHVVARAKGATS